MKIVSVPRVNALGKMGPEKMGEKVLAELGVETEEIEVDNSDVESSEKIIYSRAKEIFKEDEKVCFVGGDHSITYPIFKAFSELNQKAFLIVFDAHADCMPTMKEPTHEEFLRAIIERGLVKAENVILVGVRKIEDVEREFLEESGVKVFGEIFDLEAVADYITEKANGKDVYVSVDVDVLDPAFAPAVSYPEPNGLSSRELFYLLRRIFCIKSLKVLDVVEVVPEKDEKYDYQTVKVAAKIVEEFMNSEL
ncbi:MAG: arginase family protein [archaeon]